MDLCNHNYIVCGYNSAIVMEECSICGDEQEHDFDTYCADNGFPVVSFEDD